MRGEFPAFSKKLSKSQPQVRLYNTCGYINQSIYNVHLQLLLPPSSPLPRSTGKRPRRLTFVAFVSSVCQPVGKSARVVRNSTRAQSTHNNKLYQYYQASLSLSSSPLFVRFFNFFVSVPLCRTITLALIILVLT